jgi:antitoxin HicB
VNEEHIGSSLDEFLEQDGLLEVASAMAAKRVIAYHIRQAMRDCGIGPSELARRMGASRSTVDRLLDMDNTSVTLLTLGRAAAAVGKHLDVTLSDAPSSTRQSGRSGRSV